MTISNKKRFTIFVCVGILLLLLFIFLILNLIHKESPPDLSHAKRAIICEDNIDLYYHKKEFLTLSTGDLVYILQNNFLEDTYTISYEGRIGSVPKTCIKYYEHHPFEKFSLMVDVSEFNMRDNFKTSGDFALFVINHGINYVYMRLGGRGYGEKGNMYYDSKVLDYMAVCDFLKIPYGFYFLDEALDEEEVKEEVDFVSAFLEEHPATMNILPLAIDLEFQEGAGRADNIWKNRMPLLEKLMEEFEDKGVSCILYANALRAKDYLSDLDCDFWIARYPQNNIIPNSTFTEFIQLEQDNSFKRDILGKDNKIKSSLDKNKTYTASYPEEFLSKIIGWQFTADGASKDGIEEKTDLSIVENRFFQKYF